MACLPARLLIGLVTRAAATACGWSDDGRCGLGWRLRARGRARQARQALRDERAREERSGITNPLHHGAHSPGVSGSGGGLGGTVQHRHRGWGELSPWAALGLLLDLPCVDVRRE